MHVSLAYIVAWCYVRVVHNGAFNGVYGHGLVYLEYRPVYTRVSSHVSEEVSEMPILPCFKLSYLKLSK